MGQEDECKADSWEQCAISNYPDFSDHWPFYLCVEAASKKCGEGAGTCVLEKMEGCATSAGLDYSKLSACTGNKAEANRCMPQRKFGLSPPLIAFETLLTAPPRPLACRHPSSSEAPLCRPPPSLTGCSTRFPT